MLGILIAVQLWLSRTGGRSGGSVVAVLFAVFSVLPCPGCLILFYADSPVLAIFFCLCCPACPILVVLF
jgi:hypothetical protein